MKGSNLALVKIMLGAHLLPIYPLFGLDMILYEPLTWLYSGRNSYRDETLRRFLHPGGLQEMQESPFFASGGNVQVVEYKKLICSRLGVIVASVDEPELVVV